MRRRIEVNVVKVKKGEDGESEEGVELDYEEKLALASEYFNRAAAQVGKAVITYVIADTVRKVIIARASRPG